MAVKKAIVITNGQLEQLQAGDRLDLGNTITKTNNSGGGMVKGNLVYATGVNCDLAQADSQSTVRVAGMVLEAAADSDPTTIAPDGIVVATTTEWDAVTGETGGLTPGADYFLSAANAGQMTQTAPSTAGEFVKRVGHALSSTEFEVELQQPIKL